MTSKETKDKRLFLSCLNLNEIPKELEDFTWVEELNLSVNNLKIIQKERLPPNLKVLLLCQNFIEKIKDTDLHSNIIKLDLSNNRLNSFDGSQFLNIQKLYLCYNMITLFKFPPNVIKLDITGNYLIGLTDFPKSLKNINISSNKMIKKFPKMNYGLKKINFAFNNFYKFPKLPDSVICVNGDSNNISNINKLPSSIEILEMKHNNIHKLNCTFPPSLICMALNNNELIEIPSLTTNIKEIYINNNRLVKLPEIPDSVEILDISDNFISMDELPDELLKRNIKLNCSKKITDNIDYFWNLNSTTPLNNHVNKSNYNNEFIHSQKYSQFDNKFLYNVNGNYYGNYNYHNNYSFSFRNPKAKNNNPNFISVNNTKHIVL
jgi:hypothetical protein